MWETSRTFRKALLQLQSACQRHTRVIVYSYNDIWEPVIALAQRLRWRIPQTEQNWLSEKDPIGLLTLSGYEWLKTYRTALFQKYVPFLSAFMDRVVASRVPALEFKMMLLFPLALVIFFSGFTYTRIQYTVGLRYLAPPVPFLFVPAVLVLAQLQWRLAYVIAVTAVAQAWPVAMYRDVGRGFGAFDPILQVFIGGFQLPVLAVLSRMSAYAEHAATGVSTPPAFAVLAALLCVRWRREQV
jgi:hypothetical protein